MAAMTAVSSSSPKFSTKDSPVSSPTSDQRDHDKFSKHFFFKSAQVIIQSRLGELAKSNYQNTSANNSSWFNLGIKDLPEVSSEVRKVYSAYMAANLGGSEKALTRSSLLPPLVVEISIKTADGDSMVLEHWILNFNSEHRDTSIKMNNVVYNHLGLLLKSIVVVSRVTPAYKLSRRQSSETFVVCYRIFSGEPNTAALGRRFNSADIGAVITQVGAISMKVDYRTEMTIYPNLTSIVKSDHFSSESSMSEQQRKSGTKSSSDEYAVTSDDSQDAVRLFATSPPTDTEIGFNQKCEDILPEGPIKFGAFASSKLITPEPKTEDDPFLQFLPDSSIEESSDNVSDSVFIPQQPAKFEEPEKEEDNPILEFKTPFTAAMQANNENTDLQIFFKETPKKSNVGSLLGKKEDIDLKDISGQINNYEADLNEFDEMIKILDNTVLTSESENE